MKLNVKIILITITFVSIISSFMAFFLISTSFQNQLNSEIKQVSKQYLLLTQNIETDLVFQVGDVEQKLVAYKNGKWRFVLTDCEGNIKFQNTKYQVNPSSFKTPNPAQYAYQITEYEDGYFLYFMRNDSDRTWNILLETNVSEIFEQKKEMIETFYLLYGAISIIVTVLMYVLSNHMTASIRILVASTKQIANGNIETAVAPVKGKEFQELADSFELMRLAITKQMETLKHELQCKNDFIANFSHEMKTPLTSIVGYAETIMFQDLDKSQQHAALSYIVSEGERLERLSYKMMDLSMLNQPILLQPTNMKYFFEDLKEKIMAYLHPYSIGFSIEIEDTEVEIEPELFTTMIMNLIDNSRKAGATMIEISTQWIEHDYKIICKDNGCGIPKSAVAHVKDAFYIVDASRTYSKHGVGLGLALCERIAKLHHASLSVSSTLGEGTNVTIWWKGLYKINCDGTKSMEE